MLYILSSNVTGEFYPLTNHLTLETYKTETKSQLQSLHLSCFCVEVLFEKFFPGKESCYPGHKGFFLQMADRNTSLCFTRVTIQIWPTPETAQEIPLAPSVESCQIEWPLSTILYLKLYIVSHTVLLNNTPMTRKPSSLFWSCTFKASIVECVDWAIDFH